MKTVLLQYPDSTPAARIVNDLTELSRGTGPKGQRATASFTDAQFPGLRNKLLQRGVPLGNADIAVVTDGDEFDITGGSVELVVADGEVTGGTFTPVE